jgi:hypothetical protein
MTENRRAVARNQENGAMILPYEVRTNIVWSDMQTAATLMDSVASGRKPMQLICSVSGFGKTTIARRRFRQYGIVSEMELYRSLPPLPEMSATSFPGLPPAMLKSRPQTRQTAMCRAVRDMPPFENAKKRLFVEARPTKPISLVRTLRLCSMLQAAALLFDDPGRIAGDEAACDILKTAFGMQRTVTFETPQISQNENWRISGHGGYDPFVPPPDFAVPADLRWLWLANTNYADPAVLAKLGDHFAPLIARGLNPFWIRDDAEHDHHDLFLYVYHLATEENLLRSMGFQYEVSRKAVNFYLTHANRLVDLCPRRLELIAKAFTADQPPAALEAELNSMTPSAIIRPKLRLPASWVSVPDGVLLWPEQPFPKTKSPVEGAAPRRIRRREREYKRLHEPHQSGSRTPAATSDPEAGVGWLADDLTRLADPDPPPPIATQPVQQDTHPEPDPEAMPTLRPIPGERGQSPFDAINEVYRLPIETTCQMVADLLHRYPLDQWDRDDFDRLGEGLEGRAEWSQCAAITEPFFAFDTVHSYKVFCTEAEGVLEYRDGRLEICSWESIEQRIAPAVAEAKQRHDQRRGEQELHDILIRRLPPQRKLKVMKASIDRLFILNYTAETEEAQKALARIRTMQRDDPRFAECETFSQYVRKAMAEWRSSSTGCG